MYHKLILCIFFLISSYIFSSAQTKKIDSLKKIVDVSNGVDNKIAAIAAYCEDYSNMHRDSLDRYAYLAAELAQQTSNERLKGLAVLTLAQNFMHWGWADSVLEIVNRELPKNTVTDDEKRDIYFRLARLKAVAYGSGGKMQESLEVLYELFPVAEKYNDTTTCILSSMSIGFIAAARKEADEAIKWNNRASQFITPAYQKHLGTWYFARALIMNVKGNTDSVLYYLQKSVIFCRLFETVDRLTSAYRMQSNIYTGMGKLKEAEEALMKMIATRKLTNNNADAVIEDNLQIAAFYANTGQLKRAIQLCRNKIVMGSVRSKIEGTEKAFTNDPAVRLPYYTALAGYLQEDGDDAAYQQALEEIILLKDSVYENNKAEAIAELQTKYEVEQKENTIMSQQLTLARRNYLLFGSAGFIVMAGIIAALVFSNQRSRQKEKMQQAIEQEKRMAAASILHAEEKERKRIAADLHDNIGAYATAIRDDVDKMKDEQYQPDPLHLQNLRQHSQEIINSLRDTIWVLNKDNITITGISDRFKNYIGKLRPSYPGIHIDIKESIQHNTVIQSRQALNIFRIMQEAVHNALKHSEAKNIDVNILSNRQLLIKITDDGKGMGDVNNSLGNGLSNMHSRAAEAGMQLQISSAENAGTTIIINHHT